MEIERRWLLRGLPEWYILHPSTYYNIPLDVRHSSFTTVYIISDPELEVRIRKRLLNGEVTYSVETKLGLGLTRQESPKLLADAKLFDYYFIALGKPYFSKDHWEITLPSGQKWEINLLREPNSVQGLVVAEMEFHSEEEANQFSEQDFPEWLKPLMVKEVTYDPRYNGKNLAVHGAPNWQAEEILRIKSEDKAPELYNLLKKFLRSQEDVDKWLATPHPDLGGKAPKEVIESGHIGAVITMIEGALSGDMA